MATPRRQTIAQHVHSYAAARRRNNGGPTIAPSRGERPVLMTRRRHAYNTDTRRANIGATSARRRPKPLAGAALANSADGQDWRESSRGRRPSSSASQNNANTNSGARETRRARERPNPLRPSSMGPAGPLGCTKTVVGLGSRAARKLSHGRDSRTPNNTCCGRLRARRAARARRCKCSTQELEPKCTGKLEPNNFDLSQLSCLPSSTLKC